MKIYTKTGDKGQTCLVDGSRISKDDIRLEAYGTSDELSSFIGLLIANIKDADDQRFLLQIQNDMFLIGAALATPTFTKCNIAPTEIETEIDRIQQTLPPLHSFILPGGSVEASLSHVCRTVCRRFERCTVSLAKTAEIDENISIYLNRLSDYFFVLARKCNILANKQENTWQKTCK
ncbi:MAG: cob(I)yrinic acid a,c-diamide adenosyltransferase [Prevotellaceae bacterium]|nr:cob(I)yrinic acid a,c-diamide adenosyltransferase [Prevotellaceae bacterium]